MKVSAVPDSIDILGIPVTIFNSYAHAVTWITRQVQQRTKTSCVAVNPDKILQAKRNPELREMLEQTSITICDGIGIKLAAWILHGQRIPRCTGVDLFEEVVRASVRERWKVFLLGASNDSNEGVYKKLRTVYPNLQVAGRHHGYFQNSDDVIEDINASGADVLFVAMGSPRQEFWIAEQFRRTNASFCMGLGGTFDVFSGTAKRAPGICRKTGTEFLYRLMTNSGWTSTVKFKRALIRPRFVLEVVKCKLANNRSRA